LTAATDSEAGPFQDAVNILGDRIVSHPIVRWRRQNVEAPLTTSYSSNGVFARCIALGDQLSATVFISYRRSDSAAWAGRLADRLEALCAGYSIVLDVVSIEPGGDFTDIIRETVERADVVLVVIGRGWLTAALPSGVRRLDSETDLVRIEIETALRSNARVIPVLLDDAAMPSEADLPVSIRAISKRNAVQIRHASFRTEVGELAHFITSKHGATSAASILEKTAMTEAELRSSLEGTFRDFLALGEGRFLILEDDQGRFIQFAHDDGTLKLDLPMQHLSYPQSVEAEQLIVRKYDGELHGERTLSAYVDAEISKRPSDIATITIEVFRQVHGAVPTTELKATIDEFSSYEFETE